MNKIQKILLAVMVVLIVICSGTVGYYLGKGSQEKLVYNSVQNQADKQTSNPQPTKKAFFTYQIDIGMTTAEVEKKWGYPYDKDTYKTDGYIFLTYTYKDDFGKYIIVQFENGKVTSVGEY
jgi:hypothetical protein